jgi:hypothetical protein
MALSRPDARVRVIGPGNADSFVVSGPEALKVLIELPDAAGTDAAWLALTSIREMNWASLIEAELKRLDADSVTALSRPDSRVRVIGPGSAGSFVVSGPEALKAIVDLPDDAGTAPAWAALSSVKHC